MSERGVEMERTAFARGRLHLVVRDADGAVTERRARNLVLQAGAELVAGLFSGADGVRPVDTVMVGFGLDGADVGATALTPPPPELGIHESELRSPVQKDDFGTATDNTERTVRVSIGTVFHPTVELANITEAGLLAGDRLYNQVVFEPVTLRPGQDVTFFWEIDFPFGH